jgi:membrane carboxypeptidase/penicillin-binding protein
MSTMLADAMNRGTGSGVRTHGFKLPAGGKTGTTDSYADAWFVGYTPSIVAGVWFGRDQPEQIVPRGFAATVAVPAWAEFMKQATVDAKPDWFAVPDDLEKVAICQSSGQRATDACRLAAANHEGIVVVDYFAKGTVPREPCDIHTAEAGVGF